MHTVTLGGHSVKAQVYAITSPAGSKERGAELFWPQPSWQGSGCPQPPPPAGPARTPDPGRGRGERAPGRARQTLTPFSPHRQTWQTRVCARGCPAGAGNGVTVLGVLPW